MADDVVPDETVPNYVIGVDFANGPDRTVFVVVQEDFFGNRKIIVDGQELPEYPSWYTPSKYRKRANDYARRGLHPTGDPLGPEDETCGSCEHYRIVPWHDRTYRKCGIRQETRGPGSDIVKRWRACARWRDD